MVCVVENMLLEWERKRAHSNDGSAGLWCFETLKEVLWKCVCIHIFSSWKPMCSFVQWNEPQRARSAHSKHDNGQRHKYEEPAKRKVFKELCEKQLMFTWALQSNCKREKNEGFFFFFFFEINPNRFFFLFVCLTFLTEDRASEGRREKKLISNIFVGLSCFKSIWIKMIRNAMASGDLISACVYNVDTFWDAHSLWPI